NSGVCAHGAQSPPLAAAVCGRIMLSHSEHLTRSTVTSAPSEVDLSSLRSPHEAGTSHTAALNETTRPPQPLRRFHHPESVHASPRFTGFDRPGSVPRLIPLWAGLLNLK